MITFDNVSKWFGTHKVLDRVNLNIATGETVVICGPSGAGKTTLLRAINGLESVQEGSVSIDGINLAHPGTNLTEIRAGIGMVFQQLNLYPHLTAAENIMLAPRKVMGLGKREARDAAIRRLREVGLEKKADVYPALLSGGEQQRVAIARCMAMNPRLMLLDEPTSALDPELVKDVLDTVSVLAETGITMVIVTHQMVFAQHVASRAVFMDEGRIVEIESPAELVARPKQERTRKFMSRILYGCLPAQASGNGRRNEE